MDPAILNHLLDEARRRRLTLFIGQDLPQSVTGLPNSQQLADGLVRIFQLQGMSPEEGLSNVIQAIGRPRYQPIIQRLRDQLNSAHLSPAPFDLMVARLPITQFLTTRMDTLLNRAFELVERPAHAVVTDFDVGFATGDRATLVKIYGEVTQPASLVLSQDDLFDLPHRKRQIHLLVERAMSSSTVLFLGVDLSSPDFLNLWRGMLRSLGQFAPMAYATQPHARENERQMWLERNITLVEESGLEVVQALSQSLEAMGVPPQIPVTVTPIAPAGPPVKVYRNFDLALRPAGNGRIQAQVLRSPAGEATDVAASLADLPTASGELTDLAPHARRLGQALMPGAVAARWAASQILAEQAGEGLRLRLTFPGDGEHGGPELARIPWELAELGPAEAPQRPALRPQTPLVRYVNAPRPQDVLNVSGPLRLLVLASHVDDPTLPALDVAEELALMADALAPVVEKGALQIHWPQAEGNGFHLSRARLMDQLRRVQPHLIHYIGHGVYDERQRTGYLLLSGADQAGSAALPSLLSMTDLALLLDGGAVRFGFFNACGSGAAAGGIAQTAVRATLPAALGMQVDAPDRAASLFAGAFYRALADHWPVDAAVVEGRRILAAELGMEQGWWAMPALYTRLDDGRIFR